MPYPANLDALAQSHPHLAALVRDYERELDAVHPKWRSEKRQERRFDHFPVERLERVKWLLLRRQLLLHQEHGQPVPRDWEVRLVRDRMNQAKVMAVPTLPATPQPRAEIGGEPPPVVVVRTYPMPNPIALAERLGVPLERVESALRDRPPSEEPEAWCRAWRPPEAPAAPEVTP